MFPRVRGGRLRIDAVPWLLTTYGAIAHRGCATLAQQHLTPHVLRHTCAMTFLARGVDVTVIALWFGHYL